MSCVVYAYMKHILKPTGTQFTDTAKCLNARILTELWEKNNQALCTNKIKKDNSFFQTSLQTSLLTGFKISSKVSYKSNFFTPLTTVNTGFICILLIAWAINKNNINNRRAPRSTGFVMKTVSSDVTLSWPDNKLTVRYMNKEFRTATVLHRTDRQNWPTH